MATATRKLEEVQFKQFPISEERILFVAKFREDPPTSMKLLEVHGLEQVTYRILIPGIDYNPDLKASLMGDWVRLAGRRISREMAGKHNFTQSGELTDYTNKDMEKTVIVIPGNRNLTLDVLREGSSEIGELRFLLSAQTRPTFWASVVVGIEPGQAQAAKEAVRE